MREIKFRAWNKEEKKMFYRDIVILFRGGWHTELDKLPILDSENAELMQFTGLKDKHGKEIYEGDILGNLKESILPADNVIVEFVHGCFIPFQIVINEKRWEVLGNIYENPELFDKSETKE